MNIELKQGSEPDTFTVWVEVGLVRSDLHAEELADFLDPTNIAIRLTTDGNLSDTEWAILNMHYGVLAPA